MRRHRVCPALVAGLSLFLCLRVRAEPPVIEQINGIARIPAVKVNPAPKIDGVLDDHVWQVAPSVTDFWCTDLDKAPEAPTRMWLAYDARFLYFAFHCQDPQPQEIVAQETKRNGSFRRDDHIELHLDPTHQHRSGDDAFNFTVNARGTQGEEIPGGSAYKIEWRGDWQAAARRTDDGYTVEMAIPVAMLRFPPGQSTFGVWVDRRQARTLERSSYPKMAGTFDRTRTADWTGLQLKPAMPPLRFMPYTQLDASDASRQSRVGFDLKQQFPNGLTAMISAVPDFRNIEGDVLNLDFSYNERLARETRPFFVEGQGFLPQRQLFATQRVRDMDAGFKFFGNAGRSQLGFLGIVDGNRHRATAFDLDYKLTEEFRLGTSFAGRFDNTADATAGMINARYNKPGPSGSRYFFGNYSSLLAGGSDHSMETYVGFNPANRHLGYWAGYRYFGRNYRPVDGFVPERDVRRYSIGLEYENKIARGPIDNWQLYGQADYAQHLDGSFFYGETTGELFLGLRNGTGFSVGPSYLDRFEDGTLYRDRVMEASLSWNRFKQYRQGNLGFSFGRQAGGNLRQLRVSQGLRFGERFFVGGSVEHRNGFDEGTSSNQFQTILSANYDFTPEKGIGGRVVQRKSGVNPYLAYRQNVRRGMDLFIIIGDPNADRFTPRLALKTLFVF